MTKEKVCPDTGCFLNTAAPWLVEQVDLEPADPGSLPASSLPGILVGTVPSPVSKFLCRGWVVAHLLITRTLWGVYPLLGGQGRKQEKGYRQPP